MLRLFIVITGFISALSSFSAKRSGPEIPMGEKLPEHLLPSYFDTHSLPRNEKDVLAELDEELAGSFWGTTRLVQDASLNVHFSDQKKSFTNFLLSFVNEFAEEKIENEGLVGHINNNDNLDKALKLWKDLYLGNFEKRKNIDSKFTRICKSAAINKLSLTKETPRIIWHLLREFSSKEFSNNLQDIIYKSNGFDRARSQELFYNNYPTLADRINFSFSLLLFLTYGCKEAPNEDPIKTRLAGHSLFSELLVIKNRPVTLAHLIMEMDDNPQWIFPDQKVLFNFPVGTRDFVKALNSIKIGDSAVGMWGMGQWPQEILDKFINAAKKAGKEPDLNRMRFSLPIEKIELTVAELRLLNNQKYLGPNIKQKQIFAQIVEKFSTVQGFAKYLDLSDSWFKQMPTLNDNESSITLAEKLLRHFLTKKGLPKQQFLAALNCNIGESRKYHHDLYENLVKEMQQEDTHRQKSAQLLQKTRLTKEEQQVLGQLNDVLTVSEKPSKENIKSNKAKPKNKKKNKKKQGAERPKGNDVVDSSSQVIKKPIQPARRPYAQNKSRQYPQVSKEELEQAYPSLDTTGQELFAAHNLLLPTDSELYKDAVNRLLNFRPKCPDPTMTSVPLTHLNVGEVQDNSDSFFDTSKIQKEIMKLDILSPGFTVVLHKLAHTQEVFDEQIIYRNKISDLLHKMGFDNFLAKSKYFDAWRGFINLHQHCREFLNKYPQNSESDVSEKNIRESKLQMIWSDFEGLENTTYFEPATACQLFYYNCQTAHAQSEETLKMIKDSTTPINSNIVDGLHQQAQIFDQNLICRAQNEITRETFIVEQKIVALQEMVGVLNNFFPEVLQSVLH